MIWHRDISASLQNIQRKCEYICLTGIAHPLCLVTYQLLKRGGQVKGAQLDKRYWKTCKMGNSPSGTLVVAQGGG